MSAKQRQPAATKRRVPLHDLTLDPDLQPRADYDDDLLESIGEALAIGDLLPPVVAFDDGTKLWLADGFHRWHAHRALDWDDIECVIVPGVRADALVYSLSANAHHGKRPTKGDMQRAYRIAVENGLAEPADVARVCHLLSCTTRWASVLTRAARQEIEAREAEARAERDAEILRLKAAGESERKIAAATDTSRATVQRVLAGGPPGNSSQADHPAPPPPEDGKYDTDCPFGEDGKPIAAEPDPEPDPEEAERLERQRRAKRALSEAGGRWHAVLEALRAVNSLPTVEALFSDRHDGFDHAIGPQLTRATAWLKVFRERYCDGSA